MQNQYLDFFIVSSFQGVIKLFMLSFKKSRDKTSQTRHYLLKLKIKDFNVVIDGRRNDNITKRAIGEGH